MVVFAGSPERLDTALELTERGLAPNLVIPNGRSSELSREANQICDAVWAFTVHCPASDTINTRGEAKAIGRVATENGWSRLIAVTSSFHVHRALLHLTRCFHGEVDAVAANQDVDSDDLVEKIGHEWV